MLSALNECLKRESIESSGRHANAVEDLIRRLQATEKEAETLRAHLLCKTDKKRVATVQVRLTPGESLYRCGADCFVR